MSTRSAPLAHSVLVATLAVALAFGAGATLAHPGHGAAVERRARVPFGPWDAGEARAVKRGGKDGVARKPHPAVGDPAKVPASGPPPPALRVDPDLPERALTQGNHVGSGLSANPLYLAALVYSNFLTKVDGPRCQHYPTCSRFANQAVARHGVVGIFLGLERVITDESSSAVRRLPEIDMPNEPRPRYYDPVDNYEFWIPGRLSAFPEAVPEEPLELAPLRVANESKSGRNDDDDGVGRLSTKRLPKCKNGSTLRAPDDGNAVEDRCSPDRS